MAMTQRERMIATVTGLAVAAFAADYFAVSPYLEARAAVIGEADKAVEYARRAGAQRPRTQGIPQGIQGLATVICLSSRGEWAPMRL